VMANVVAHPGERLVKRVPSSELQAGDLVAVRAGEVIPADGNVVQGVASVDESAITGESAPVIRESGGDRSAVTGGTRVISDWLVIQVTAKPGESFLDRMIAMVEGAKRQKTPNEVALTVVLAGMTLVFLMVCVTLYPIARYFGVTIDVIGESGVLFVDAYSNTLDLAEDRTPSYTWMPVEHTGDPEMVTAFIDAVRNDTETQVTGEDGLRALQVALCAYESAKRQEPVPVVTAP